VNFEAYVEGRSIAVIGPAPAVRDQRAEVDKHDVVYRIFGHLTDSTYTDRADVVFFNGAQARTLYEPERAEARQIAEQAPWWVFKQARTRHDHPDGSDRVAILPNVRNANAVTAILTDLCRWRPDRVTVYGADLYSGGPGAAYYAGFNRHTLAVQAQAFIAHQPQQQLRTHKAIYQRLAIAGDDRYLAAIRQTPEEYQAVIDAWAAVTDIDQTAGATLT